MSRIITEWKNPSGLVVLIYKIDNYFRYFELLHILQQLSFYPVCLL